jgi:hypothetical protein
MEINIMPKKTRSESIYKLRDLLTGQISGGTNRKLSVYVNESQPQEKDCICLFYNEDNDWVSAIHKKAPYYKNGVQVSIRHNDYDQSRTSAYTALEYINSNRKTLSGVYFIPDTTPIYIGEDVTTKGYWFGFNVNIKGAK